MHFIETLVELTSHVSGLENKIDKIAINLKTKQVEQEMEDCIKENATLTEENKEKELKVNAETYNRFESLQNNENDKDTENTRNSDKQQWDKNKSNLDLRQDHHKDKRIDKIEQIEGNELPQKDTSVRQDIKNNTNETFSSHKDKFLKYEELVIDLWIVGTSITKKININSRLMHNNKVVKVSTLINDKSISEAKAYIEKSNVKVKVLGETKGIEEQWIDIKQAICEVGEQTLDFKDRTQPEWITANSINKIQEQKRTKQKISATRSQRQKEKLEKDYKEKDNEVRFSTRDDERKYIDNIANSAENAANKGEQNKLYMLSKKNSNSGMRGSIPVKSMREMY
ncbi:unnamed protein product [Mytilus coruscus]|uniref:Uncharacterized protein n=1 Tax=Mytilus coruscus TaxID=42192 RepID=A0A6J8EEM6_MYTCO|nr:unnamed protein product [Mytilus coruscus]